MKDDNKTKKQLIHELTELRSQNAELKKSITEATLAVLEADKASQYSENIVETVREPLLILDADLKVISANHNFYRTFEVTPGETIGNFIYDLGNKQWNIPKLREVLEEILPKIKVLNDFEVSHNFSDIGHKIMLLNARQIYRKDIGTHMILLAIEDITERKRLEDILSEAEERYRNVFETANDGIVLIEKREGKIVFANQAVEKLLGYSLKETFGKKLKDIGIVDIDDFQTIMQILDKTGIINFTNVPIKTRSGQHIDVEIYLADRAKLIQCNIRDISERKRAYENLINETRLRESLLDNIPDCIALILKKDTHEIVASNKFAREMGAVPGQTCFKTCAMRDDNCPFCLAPKLWETGKLQRLEVEYSGKWYEGIWALLSEDLYVHYIFDITERKRIDEELLQREEKYCSLVIATSQIVWTTNAQGEVVNDLPTWKAYTGQSDEEIKNMGWVNALHPDDRELIKAIWLHAVETRSLYDTEYRLRRYDGVYHYFAARGVPVLEKDGSIREWVGTCNDIDERKQSEEALRESEARLREAQHLSNIGSWDLDLQKNRLIWSDENRRIFEIEPSEFGISYETFLTAVHPDDREMVNKAYTESVKNRKPYAIDHRLLMKDGRIKYVQERCETLYDDQGNPVRSFGTTQDITERKRADEQLRFQAHIIDNSPIIAAYHDKDLNMVWANRAYQKATGLSLEDIRGRKCYEVWNLPKPCRGCPVIKAIETGENAAHELTPYNQDHWPETQGYWLSEAAPVRDEQGAVIGAIEFALDITKLKQAEAALLESEKRFMDILYSSSDAVLLIDGEQFVDCNEATARMLGYSNRNEFLKTHPSELSPPTQPDGRNSFEKANEMMRIASEGGFHQFEWYHRRANGEDFPVEVSLTSIVLHRKIVIHCMWRDITERKRTAEELQQTLERLKKAINTTIQVMVSAVEVRDPYTSGHQLRSADLARNIATEMELPPNIIDGIRMAGSIHDIGKISIPAEILSKPGKLSAIEFSLVKEHSRRGYEMLKDVESPWPLAQIVYQHHERMDGSGYPRNLKGDEILMEARIMAVADVVEAMASHRPYRPGLGIDAALNEIEKNRGIFYDNAVADACLRLFREKGFKLEGA